MSNVFNQMKDMYKMQREAKKLQKQMKQVKVTGESRNGLVKMYYNGAQELEDMRIDPELLDEERHDDLVNAIKEAQKDFQKKLQKQMAKDMDIGQLKSMLGG
ncbi:MAG: YbaB/EbfC family nucleoid-associated protein [Patescibacteria group bacterium]|nr:YbaB/EbfC family nucleoid-associated protein [Patescibacteria group bacterium]